MKRHPAEDGTLVDRLRVHAFYQNGAFMIETSALLTEAADEIERLRDEVKDLEYAIVRAPADPIGPHDCRRCGKGPLVVGEFCRWCAQATDRYAPQHQRVIANAIKKVYELAGVDPPKVNAPLQAP